MGIRTSDPVKWRARWKQLETRYSREVDEVVVKGAMIAGATEAVASTPRLTGRARANWRIGQRAGSRFDENIFDDGAATVRRLTSEILKIPPLRSITLFNALPYVPFLNDGTRNNRPHNMEFRAKLAAERYLERVRLRFMN